MHNKTGKSFEEVEAMQYLGRRLSWWRLRSIHVFQDPEDPDRVYTVGYTIRASEEARRRAASGLHPYNDTYVIDYSAPFNLAHEIRDNYFQRDGAFIKESF